MVRDIKKSINFDQNGQQQLQQLISSAASGNDLIEKSLSTHVKRITDFVSDKFTHFLRFKNDAVMISSKTLNIDNPKLNCRLRGYEKFSPIRIILDRDLKIYLP